MIQGLAVLSFSFLLGMWAGELLGTWLGIDANVGGVGFAMIFLLLLAETFRKNGWWKKEFEFGIEFWNKLYIPVVIAMAASLNVKSALSAGTLAILAGIVPVLLAFWVFKILTKSFPAAHE
ncbi:malonate transporter subunit MadL [Algoriphagus aestuariicola]|uniref:Malonate transporter subunit MadL n=1 Tax=Algoriphagus aestuariicola TaxID=1852016 RepID=A0ABS3BNX4_9BACT|nr:malonate transporter subunit MadL [Algoriphagus aestuariicola]MBN7800524.1 malonate transporter subunit MadL [Algoriphagus aestuariicola]